ncbi:MAG: hypothetical protein JOZ43_06345 [Acidobacteriales bacterium]|nr:hypothetical protein [Terriglobales bacterium]
MLFASNNMEHIVDLKLKRLMKELGDTINTSLSESEQIAEVVTRIKQQGYDVFLVLEATIGFNKRESEEGKVVAGDAASTKPELQMNQQDLRFLRSLRISLDDPPNEIRHSA